MDKDMSEYMYDPSLMSERSVRIRKQIIKLCSERDSYEDLEYFFTDLFKLTHDYILRRYSRGFMTSINPHDIRNCTEFLTTEYINWYILYWMTPGDFIGSINVMFSKFASNYYQFIRYNAQEEDIYYDTDAHHSLKEMSGLVRPDSNYDYNNIVELNSIIPMEDLPDFILNKYCDLPIDTPEYKYVSISLYMSIVERHPRMYCLDDSWYGYVHYLYNSYIVEMKYNNYKRMMKIHVERGERIILDDYDGIVPVA